MLFLPIVFLYVLLLDQGIDGRLSRKTTRTASCPADITSYTLIDAMADEPLLTLTNGAIVSLCDDTPVNIVAETSAVCAGQKVRFSRQSGLSGNVEGRKPYSWFDDFDSDPNNVDYLGKVLAPGTYTVRAKTQYRNKSGPFNQIAFTIESRARCADGSCPAYGTPCLDELCPDGSPVQSGECCQNHHHCSDGITCVADDECCTELCYTGDNGKHGRGCLLDTT
jgi:hypothetical protein